MAAKPSNEKLFDLAIDFPRVMAYNERMKRVKNKGKSMRNGNSPSPYTKYGKKPYEYGNNVLAVYRCVGKTRIGIE